MLTVCSIIGTRPEAIKMAPLIKALAMYPEQIKSVICVTAQHRQLLDQVLNYFAIAPDYDLNLMCEQQTLAGLSAAILTAIDPVLAEVRPDWILVQGDTTTTMVTSLAAFYRRIKVGHVEAGLRTYRKHAPFPEEINRHITALIADLHFAPTKKAQQALLAEGIPGTAIHITGNTIVDALAWIRDTIEQHQPDLPGELVDGLIERKLLLVTAHRRESFGEGIEQLCLALHDLASTHADIVIIYPVHPNPALRKTVYKMLNGVKRIHLIDPLPYAPFVWLMNQAYVILTDSGGVQEEAAALGKPVLILREATERLEGIMANNALLVGLDRAYIVEQAQKLLQDAEAYQSMSVIHHLYGDGHAAHRIVQAILAETLQELAV